jgi:hypothetical protein
MRRSILLVLLILTIFLISCESTIERYAQGLQQSIEEQKLFNEDKRTVWHCNKIRISEDLRSDCFLDVALLKNDYTVCDKSMPGSYKYDDDCVARYAITKEDKELCFKMLDFENSLKERYYFSSKLSCFKEIAINTGDPDFCENIKVLESKTPSEDTFIDVSREHSVCLKEATKHGAILNQDLKICNTLENNLREDCIYNAGQSFLDKEVCEIYFCEENYNESFPQIQNCDSLEYGSEEYWDCKYVELSQPKNSCQDCISSIDENIKKLRICESFEFGSQDSDDCWSRLAKALHRIDLCENVLDTQANFYCNKNIKLSSFGTPSTYFYY